jgi:hypothetical protein
MCQDRIQPGKVCIADPECVDSIRSHRRIQIELHPPWIHDDASVSLLAERPQSSSPTTDIRLRQQPITQKNAFVGPRIAVLVKLDPAALRGNPKQVSLDFKDLGLLAHKIGTLLRGVAIDYETDVAVREHGPDIDRRLDSSQRA